MIVVALVLIGLAVAIHGYIFVLESITWTTPKTRAIFGVRSDAEAQATKSLAFNQGFYNLFLAIIAGLGIVMIIAGQTMIGATLIFAGAGAMLAAALVLIISSPKMARAAAVQGAAPLLGLIALVIGSVTS